MRETCVGRRLMNIAEEEAVRRGAVEFSLTHSISRRASFTNDSAMSRLGASKTILRGTVAFSSKKPSPAAFNSLNDYFSIRSWKTLCAHPIRPAPPNLSITQQRNKSFRCHYASINVNNSSATVLVRRSRLTIPREHVQRHFRHGRRAHASPRECPPERMHSRSGGLLEGKANADLTFATRKDLRGRRRSAGARLVGRDASEIGIVE
jgi:hypothetical protein